MAARAELSRLWQRRDAAVGGPRSEGADSVGGEPGRLLGGLRAPPAECVGGAGDPRFLDCGSAGASGQLFDDGKPDRDGAC